MALCNTGEFTAAKVRNFFCNFVLFNYARNISIVETGKENGLNQYTYLQYLFEEMPNMDIADPQQLERLFPWSKELPASVEAKNKYKP